MSDYTHDVTRIKKAIEKYEIDLTPPVSKEAIKQFEEKYKIELPKDLVFFYTEISNGIEGVHELVPFEKWEDWEESWNDHGIDPELIIKEFPFEDDWIWENDEHPLPREKYESVSYGNFPLIDLGCGMSCNIIVTGREKGIMWHFADVGIHPSEPKVGFLGWLADLLETDYDLFW